MEGKQEYAPQTPEQAANWLPSVMDIRDQDVREETITAILEAPDYFFVAPAATSYHPVEHRARHGLILHTQRVATAFERLCTSMVRQGHLEWYDVDCARAACLCHDMLKYGEPPTSIDHTVDHHDVAAAEWLSERTDLPDATIDAVREHQGPWGDGPSPSSHVSQMVHVADMVASDVNCDVGVKQPHEIIKAQFPKVAVRD